MYDYICQTCGQSFRHANKGMKNCSRSCRDAAATTLSDTKCLVCGAVIERRSPPGKYCSKKCHGESLKGKSNPVTAQPETCSACGEAMLVPPHREGRQKFCSRDCYLAVHTADNVTPELDLLRHSAAYREWRTAVFERDDYTCQECGDRGGELNADHIKTFAHHPDLRFELSNGRTLCVPCHRKTDTYGGRARQAVGY